MNRSINVELELEAGDYVVVVKIDALRNEQIMPVEDVIRAFAKERREKLLRIGFAYDLAHSKGRIIETPEEKAARENYENKKRERERKKMAKLIMKQREEDRKHAIRQTMKKKKAAEKARARARARNERRLAKREAKEKAEEEKVKKEREAKEKAEEEKKKKEKGANRADKPPEGSKTQGDTTSAKVKDTEGSQDPDNKDSEAPAPTSDKKGVRLEIRCEDKSAAEESKDGNDSSTEPGDNTPASSTMFERTPIETEETQEEDAYVTAAEEEGESQPMPSMETSTGEEPPPTPKASQPRPEKAKQKPSADKTERPPHNHVDIGVQTGPGLPSPPRAHGPPPGFMFSPPPPPPGRGPMYGPPRGIRHQLPPNSRIVPYTSPPPPPPPGASSSYFTSDASTDDGIEDLDSLSEVSEHEIDLYLEAQDKQRAAAARAAKANQPSSPSPPNGPSCEDELSEFEKDPWNAVGVFGLRVYYKSDGGAGENGVVKLRVERPNPYVWEDDSDDEADDEKEKEKEKKEDGGKEAKDEANESQVLDIDDSGKDAIAENVTAEEKEEDKKELEGDAPSKTTSDDAEVPKKAEDGKSEGDSPKDTETGKVPGEPNAKQPEQKVEASSVKEAEPEKKVTPVGTPGT